MCSKILFFPLNRIIAIAVIISSFSCVAQSTSTEKNTISFKEDATIFPAEERSRRKFDNAVIADLDQDGYLDLLLTEHSRRVELFWNDKGVFTQGKSFIFGDTHGIAIADFDFDKKIDVLVQPGGGDGKNPRKIKHFTVDKNRKIKAQKELTHFEASRGRAVKFIDIDHNGSLDLLTSAFPTIKALDQGNRLYKRDQKIKFKFIEYLAHADRIGMRTSLVDFNNDNITDIIFHGGQKVVAVQGKKDGTFKEVTKDVLGELGKTKFVNNVSEIDFDNDGDNDLFFTRSKLPFPSEADYSAKHKTFYFFARRKPFDFNLKVEGDLKIENLQMAFPHFDINIGENKTLWKRTLDKHGHHDLTITKKEAKGWAKDISKRGLYIGYLGDGIWRVAGHTNSPTTAVLHNVLEKPKTIELKNMPAKLLENRDGKFFDATSDLGINIKEQTSGSAVGDFNNDGFSDIFIVRFGNSAQQTKQILYLNKKGEKFEIVTSHGIISKELGATGMAPDAFDYDKDGDLDIIFSNERGRWHLFTNNSNLSKNKFIQVNVGYSPAFKASAMGAILTLEACGKKYKRVVGATSSSYSHSFNTYLHVGLGKCTKIENAKVTWSNGEQLSLNIKTFNKIYQIGK